ncbi:MAG: N-acetyltransferase [Elusimicrobia bacterium]|nr:N-acetyltransferase [Elusimicrobiota bacterium]
MSVDIRAARPQDAEALARVYNHYIEKTIVTFEESPVTAADMRARLAEIQGHSLPWLVAESGGALLGYAYGAKWKGRCSYRFSTESTIYLAQDAVGRGVGSSLYAALLAELRARKLHVVIGGVALPNDASIRLHEKLGFQKAAHFKEVGFKFGRWIDVGYWQLTLETPP